MRQSIKCCGSQQPAASNWNELMLVTRVWFEWYVCLCHEIAFGVGAFDRNNTCYCISHRLMFRIHRTHLHHENFQTYFIWFNERHELTVETTSTYTKPQFAIRTRLLTQILLFVPSTCCHIHSLHKLCVVVSLADGSHMRNRFVAFAHQFALYAKVNEVDSLTEREHRCAHTYGLWIQIMTLLKDMYVRCA